MATPGGDGGGPRPEHPPGPAVLSRIVLGLYAVELCGAAAALTWYRKGDRAVGDFLRHPAGMAWVLVLAAAVAACWWLVGRARSVPTPRLSAVLPSLAANLLPLLMAFALGEAAVRVGATDKLGAPAIGGRPLLPHRWDQFVRTNLQAVAEVQAHRTYLDADTLLGWSVGASRRGRHQHPELDPPGGAAGLQAQMARSAEADTASYIYLSSIEGLRSPSVPYSFAARPRPRRRIALVGDSFTFGLEVRYEETWGFQLEQLLGVDAQVLNFGVDGFGVDQAYLRYQRDVVGWSPDVVIFGLIDDDVRRVQCVYAFLCFQANYLPFAKPRFVVEAGDLQLLNLPLSPPARTFHTSSINRLPFIEFDGSYRSSDWDWGFYDYSYLVRLLLTSYQPWITPRPMVSDSAESAVTGRVLQAFVAAARANGSTPVVVYFPSLGRNGLSTGSTPATGILGAYGIPYINMSSCLLRVRPQDRFVTNHYTATANRAVARCLLEAVPKLLPASHAGR